MKSLATLAARALREDAHVPAPDPDTRAAAISAIRDAMRVERRRRRMRVVAGVSVLLAAAAALVLVRRSAPEVAPVATMPTPRAIEPPPVETVAVPPVTFASDETASTPPRPPPSARPSRPARPGTGVAAGEGATASPERLASDLAKQNDLFDRALARKQAGDARGAIAALDELLRTYPSTRLGQSARADRMKLLRGLDPVAARRAAEEYLRLHPAGFARQDAERILAGP